METAIVETLSRGLELIFYILVLISALHTLILAYHWFSYGSSMRVSTTACIIYGMGHVFFFTALWITIQFI